MNLTWKGVEFRQMAKEINLEQKLWEMADALRGNVASADYKEVVFGLIFLKYISDSFETKHNQLKSAGEDPEEKDWYVAENIYWVPKQARWSFIRDYAKQAAIGSMIDKRLLSWRWKTTLNNSAIWSPLLFPAIGVNS